MIFLQKVECKPWLEISLINKTDIILKFISWTQSGIPIDYSGENIFLHFPHRVKWTSTTLFN